VHSHECKIYKSLYPRVLPNSARAVLRIVLRHDHAKDDPAEFQAFLNLETHTFEILAENEDQWTRILLSARAVKEYSNTQMDVETIASFFAAVSGFSA
jgi:hypothetical protein